MAPSKARANIGFDLILSPSPCQPATAARFGAAQRVQSRLFTWSKPRQVAPEHQNHHTIRCRTTLGQWGLSRFGLESFPHESRGMRVALPAVLGGIQPLLLWGIFALAGRVVPH